MLQSFTLPEEWACAGMKWLEYYCSALNCWKGFFFWEFMVAYRSVYVNREKKKIHSVISQPCVLARLSLIFLWMNFNFSLFPPPYSPISVFSPLFPLLLLCSASWWIARNVFLTSQSAKDHVQKNSASDIQSIKMLWKLKLMRLHVHQQRGCIRRVQQKGLNFGQL